MADDSIEINKMSAEQLRGVVQQLMTHLGASTLDISNYKARIQDLESQVNQLEVKLQESPVLSVHSSNPPAEIVDMKSPEAENAEPVSEAVSDPAETATDQSGEESSDVNSSSNAPVGG